MDSFNSYLDSVVSENMDVRKKRQYVARINPCGNFCGHEPNAHRTTLTRPAKTGKGGIPPILNKLIERLSQYYYSPSKVLPDLNMANKSNRQQRSERREACMLVLRSLAKNMDLSSMRVGHSTKDGFVNMRLVVIKNDTGMTMVRVERAIRDLKNAGIISSTQPRQLDKNGNWKGLASVKVISKQVFAVFGLKVALEFEQKKAVNRLKKKAQSWNSSDGKRRTIADIARFKMSSKKVASFAASQSKKTNVNKNVTPKKGNEEYERRRMAMLTELATSYPDWTAEELYKEAEQKLQVRRTA